VKPLEDVRIIAVEQYGAGPFGSVHLADLGADVIKIEDPTVGGDVGRYVPPYGEEEDSLFFETFNRNKKSLSLDLSSQAGREVFERLVANADAVYSNLRGDVPKKIGITYEDLKHINPAIVCCSLTGFGMTGPRQKLPGYDYVLQGLAGWMDLTGEPDGPPTKSGLSLVDYSGGLVAAISLLVGLHAAKRDGVGMDCDVSLFDTAIAMLTYPAVWHLNEGFTPRRTHHSAHPSLVPFQAFETVDSWIVVGCAKEKFWTRLVAVLGEPQWAQDERFATFAVRDRHRDVLLPLLEEEFRRRPGKDWLEVLEVAGIPCAPINDVASALRDNHTTARNLIVETEHPRFGTIQQLSSPVRVGSELPDYRRAPRRNEDFQHVVHGVAGYTDEEIESLRRAGAFGDMGLPRHAGEQVDAFEVEGAAK
jgi:crotonobetainyl-CoA:carnitine CoA-transferase CaiB-like acyl-CoA transferase